MAGTSYFHVDVFAAGPLNGNGLTVFLDTDDWSATAMQRLTQEMKHFESIFLSRVGPSGATARVFTVEEELPFAGHPVLGAATVLHRTQAPEAASCRWAFELPSGTIAVTTWKREGHHVAEMDQGVAITGPLLPSSALEPILARLGLQPQDLAAGLRAQVVSTGLPYLVVPVRPEALARTSINGTDLEALLGTLGAKFVFVFDAAGRELRTWDNLGQVEDVATGSAAGPAAAYLFGAGLASLDQPVRLSQGRFAGRPSALHVRGDHGHLLVSGAVWPVGRGVLDLASAALAG